MTAIRAPLSGHTLCWRHDGYYQSFGVTDHVDEDAWTPWGYDLDGYQHFQEVSPGDSDAPTWWLCTGEARPTAKISAWLADNRDVPTLRLGGLWLVEYVHTPIALFIEIAADLITHYPYRSAVEPPAKFPYNGYARNPRSPR